MCLISKKLDVMETKQCKIQIEHLQIRLEPLKKYLT